MAAVGVSERTVELVGGPHDGLVLTGVAEADEHGDGAFMTVPEWARRTSRAGICSGTGARPANRGTGAPSMRQGFCLSVGAATGRGRRA